jgi:hypothetical protein
MQGQGAFRPGGILHWCVGSLGRFPRRSTPPKKTQYGRKLDVRFGPCWPRNRADNGDTKKQTVTCLEQSVVGLEGRCRRQCTVTNELSM